MTARIDIGRLLTHLETSTRASVVLTFERGVVVERSHAQVAADVHAAVGRLRSWGVVPGMRIGIRAPNCYAWIVYDLACLSLRAVTVAFTDDFTTVRPSTLIARYGLSLLLVSHREAASSSDARSEHVAVLDDDGGHCVARPVPGSPDPEWRTPWLIFSSGSSAGAKGLVLTRTGVEENIHVFVNAIAPTAADRLLLFLPISNFQQRMMYYAALWYGFDLVVTDLGGLFQGLRDLAPTLLIAPPVFYETFESRIAAVGGWRGAAVRTASAIVPRLPGAFVRRHAARLIFRDVYKALGGRMRFMVTGMAPIRRSTLELFSALQLPLFETYGLIEAGPLTLNVPGASKAGSVGRPLPGVHLDFASDGEVIVTQRHRNAASYFEAAAGETERTFLDHRRIATGDIGTLDADGFLWLMGRKKEIIVTSGGDKIHPEVIEAELGACADVERAVILHDEGTGLVAIVRPKSPSDASARARIEAFARMRVGSRPTFELSSIIFTEQPFSRENGFLRPNLKLDRRRIAAHFIGARGSDASASSAAAAHAQSTAAYTRVDA